MPDGCRENIMICFSKSYDIKFKNQESNIIFKELDAGRIILFDVYFKG